jgi:SNF2 family DNA or RNA helicase
MENISNRFKSFLEFTSYAHKIHQEEGVKWCVQHEYKKQDHQDINGGIIADEMGCGKTVMMIGVVVCNFVPRTLIVVPLALLNQWSKSIYDLTGHIPLVYYGSSINRTSNRIKQGSSPIVLTTYGVLTHKYNRNDVLFETMWDRVIYDEAHHMRNITTKKYISGKAIKSKTKWLLTGTPIQNKMNDLYNLSSIVGISGASKLDKDLLQKNILKRTKTSVGIQLPALNIHKQYIDWANDDEKLLSKILHSLTKVNKNEHPKLNCSISSDSKSSNELHAEYIESYDYNDYNDSNDSYDNEISYNSDEKELNHIDKECIIQYDTQEDLSCKLKHYVTKILGKYYLPYFLRCRQMCICPKLISKLQNNCHKSELNDPSIIENALKHMNKVKDVVNIIGKNYSNGNKKIIFCQYREEMDIMKSELRDANITDVATYDGRITRKQRINILESMPNILILQIQMGCEGLNLQYANEIYFMGPLWNPAVIDQAIGRCYRLGQTKETHVYQFLMKDIEYKDEIITSMDTYMSQTLQEKKDLQVI